MPRKMGDLPGRYVLPYVRSLPNQPSEYSNVSGYQERVEPNPSPLESVPPQGELELVTVSGAEDKEEDDDNSQ